MAKLQILEPEAIGGSSTRINNQEQWKRYNDAYFHLKQELEGLFPGLLDITGEGTPGVTGYFEVQVVGGKLLHSKKNGNGFVDSAAKMQTIVDGVKAALDERS
ncbi:hypothetical protein OUZ56_016104 [Daphnia magna]|uniref:Selenoprotein W n=1 Tax=Daphnia magna TaxID=35525 RepID=A0ABR0APS3_9CRUS|nr:hypothetical protein OUZ56_016104 [Daphnia magna]